MAKKKFDNVLFIGTGGGNDVFSTTLAAMSLWEKGYRWKECSFAGILSPFHIHTNHFTKTSGVELIHAAAERFVPRKGDPMKIGYVDAAFAAMVEEMRPCNATSVLGLSVAQGSVGLSLSLRELSEVYDFMVLVDIGGDIFYGGKDDTHVLSPMFDAMVLRAFIDAEVPGILFEAGPGTDGELDPESLERAFRETRAHEYPLDKEVMAQWNDLYLTWIAPVRQGRTVPVTIEAFRSKKAVITMEYRARSHMKSTKKYQKFDHRIRTAPCKNFYLVEPRNISNPFAVRCSSPYEWFIQTQVDQHATNCEANLEYFRRDGIVYQFLTPSPLFPEATRSAFLIQGLEELHAGISDKVLVFPADWKKLSVEWEPKTKVSTARKLVELERM